MRSLKLLVVLVALSLLTACSGSGLQRTDSPYSNWHALQDRGGSR